MKITKTKSGKYHARVYVGEYDGKKKFISVTAPTKAECQIKCADILVKKNADPGKTTVRQAMEMYIEKKTGKIAKSTLRLYTTIMNNSFRPIQGILISKLSTALIQRAVDEEARKDTRHGKITAKYVATAYGFLKVSILAVDRFADFTGIELPKKERLKYNTPPPDVLKRIYDAAKGTTMELPIYLASQMSLRRSEICGLKWSDVDMTNGTIHVSRAVVLGEEKKTKTESSDRIIPMSPRVREILCNLPHTGDNIFPFVPDYITEHFRLLLEANGIPLCRFHDLRHCFASNAMLAGVPDKYIQELGGWSTSDVMRAVYQNTFDDPKREAIEKISALFPQ